MKPNILVILADQHRFDCLGATGNRDIRTPNLDALARDGATYENCFCAYPICTPSRYSLLTGLYVHQHRGGDNHCTIPPAMATLPNTLAKNGYKTAAVGKMHFTPTYLDVGFQEMKLSEQHGPGRYDDDYHRYLRDKGLLDSVDIVDQVAEYRQGAPKEYWDCYGAIESNLDEKDYSTTWIGDRAMEQLSKWSGEGNLLMVGFIKPHHPFDPPKPWSGMYDPRSLHILEGWTEAFLGRDLNISPGYFPREGLNEQKLKKIMAYYYAGISMLDNQVGRMIRYLREKNLYDNTVIVYTADHGEYLGYHRLVLKGNYMYDPVMKVPLIIKYPGAKMKGAGCDELVSLIDITPTLLEEAGCAVPPEMAGKPIPGHNAEFIFSEGERQYMVRSKRYKLILCAPGIQSLFFDLQNDPCELNNLFDDKRYAELIGAYKEKLIEWICFNTNEYRFLDEGEQAILVRDKADVESLKAYYDHPAALYKDVLRL